MLIPHILLHLSSAPRLQLCSTSLSFNLQILIIFFTSTPSSTTLIHASLSQSVRVSQFISMVIKSIETSLKKKNIFIHILN